MKFFVAKIPVSKFLFLYLLLALFLIGSPVQADDKSQFRPVFKLRGDLECWPTAPSQGNNSGICRSKGDFLNNPPRVYWEKYQETVNGKVHKLITYWGYYGNQNACSTLGGAHVDDWENITVHIVDHQLKHVTFSQHNGRYTLAADSVELDSTHPVVYIGKYSHGNYHDQRSKCSANNWCYTTGRYCYYWRDPRGPGETWSPQLSKLSNVGQSSVFPGSENPLTRDLRPHERTVCRTDGGRVIGGIIDGTENTCDRNPNYLKDETMILRDMFYLNIY